jgi:hypothetical protein
MHSPNDNAYIARFRASRTREANIQKLWSCKPHRNRKLLLENSVKFWRERNAPSSRLRFAWISAKSRANRRLRSGPRQKMPNWMWTSTWRAARNHVLSRQASATTIYRAAKMPSQGNWMKIVGTTHCRAGIRCELRGGKVKESVVDRGSRLLKYVTRLHGRYSPSF